MRRQLTALPGGKPRISGMGPSLVTRSFTYMVDFTQTPPVLLKWEQLFDVSKFLLESCLGWFAKRLVWLSEGNPEDGKDQSIEGFWIFHTANAHCK